MFRGVVTAFISMSKENDLLKLFRVTAYVVRFVNNMESYRREALETKRYVTSVEMKHSKYLCIKVTYHCGDYGYGKYVMCYCFIVTK